MGNCVICSGEDSKQNAFNPQVGLSTRENLVFNTKNRDVQDYYEVLEILGEGSMGKVSCVRKKTEKVGGSAYTVQIKGWFGRRISKKVPPTHTDGSNSHRKLYALKSIILSRVSDEFVEELRNEISILQKLDHPNIVKAFEIYETKINIYVVLQHCSGGDLYRRVPYSEKQSAKIVGKLLSAIAHMHDHNICHRDIKFENVMFESNDPDAEIKLIDFGLSKVYSSEKKFMTAGVGTVYTMAPQVLKGVYTAQADLWSIGVITYMLLSNTKPFYGKKRRHVINKILKGDFKFYSEKWNEVSSESKDFVKALIEVDPKKRLKSTAALAHRWLDKQFSLSERGPEQTVMESVHESMTAYAGVSDFKKMALMVIAHQSTTEEIVELRKAFDVYDTGNNGTISLEEFQAAMQQASNGIYSDAHVKEIFKSVDTGDDNEIYYLEFLAATIEARGRITEERLADAFDRLDSDDSGYISRENFRSILGNDYSEEKVDQFLKEADENGDGVISFQEFMKFFRKDQNSQVSAMAAEQSERCYDSESEDE
jgi:calcium-dependent protein kinase